MMSAVMDEIAVTPFDLEQASHHDEEALIRAAQRDPAVFGELYKRYHGRIHSYLRARVYSDDDAVDLTAQVFLQAFKALPKYRSRGAPFAAWLFRIARNVATDAYRRRRGTVSLDAAPESEHPAHEEDPEAVALRREQVTRIGALVAELPENKREVVLLRFAAGLTLREIAAIIGKRESTVHHHLQAALKILKERFREE
jgi:RNA polymerase sigma-70 factor (ECF subfamily)